MARTALSALLAAALLACARATSLATCPATNGAAGCYIGLTPSPTAATAATALPMSTAIALERAGGLNYTAASAGVCSTLTFTCNAALGTLYASPLTQSTVAGFAGGACIDKTVTPNVLIVNNITYTGYGAFTTADCATTASGLQLALTLPGIGDLLRASIVSMTACGTTNCNAPPSSGAARASATAGAAAAVLLAAAALA
jgi:hypothetical protein